MIVPMKKVTLLCLAHARDATLEQLRDLGVVHLQPVSQRESESVEAARREFEYVRNALEVLPHHPDKAPSGRAPRAVVEELWKLIHEQRAIEDEQIALAHEEQRLAPFGNFNPATVHALRERGVFVHLYQASPKLPAVVPDGAVYVELARDKTSVHFAVFARGPVEVQNAQEVALPAKSLAEVRQRHAALTDRQRAIEEEIARYGGDHAQVAALLADAEDKWKFAEAQAGMGAGAGETIAYLQGFCPAEEVAKLQKAAPSHGWGLVVEEPGDSDAVPTLLRHPRWVKPVQPVLDMIGILPGYREVDISGAFLLFLALFFAILIGDAGYGALFLAGSVWARRKWPQASARLFTLINIMSGATILWGVLTGVYFGYSPASLRFLEWPWLKNDENVKWLAFTIGVAHLTLAHVWNIVRAPRSLQSVAQFGWICTTWTMYFFALKMVLGKPMPGFVLPVFAVGVVSIVLFMTPRRQLKEEWFNHAMLPLNLVSNFVDVVSYIRLFAVGTASLAVASSFNSMLAPLFAQWWTAIFGVAFLFLAHALNIALCLMGVMVHGIRLNTLEFSGHIGLQWTGTAFAPFRSVKQQSQSE
jgi:V/A-type H+-transporting ATPase subunit I